MLFIDAPDALDRLAQVEGESWKREQLAKPDNPFGFQTYLRAFRELSKSGVTVDEQVGCFVEGGDHAIYGNGGYSRYIVLADGEVVLLAWSLDGRVEKRNRVQSAGIRISDEPKPSTRVQLPPQVRRHVECQLETLQVLSRARLTDQRFNGRGRYEAETYEHHRESVDRALQALAEFEEICKSKGIDPNVAYAELGRPIQLSEDARHWLQQECSPAPAAPP